MEYQFHEAAGEFPLLDEERLNELADDIAKNGLKEPICLYKGKILDGRNRYLACQLRNITPVFETLPDTIDPFSYVWSKNGERRDLTAAQRYGIWKNCMEKSARWQAEQQRIQEEANRKRAEAAKERERTEKGTFQAKTEPVRPQLVDGLAKKSAPRGQGSQAKAMASKTNRGTVERMDRLYRKRRDLYDAVVAGKITEAAAIRQMKKDEIREKLKEIASRQPQEIKKKYDVIVIDPPWPIKKIERDERPNQVDLDYPTMSISELTALDIPAAEDCHLWLWTTQKFLPVAFDLLKTWGFRYICTFVWHKPGGFQPVGLPQYNCEFALYGRKGSPTFFETKALNTCFNAPRGKHSEKPQEFYEMVRRVTEGRRLDMFSRRKIEGFDSWGKEAP